MPTVHAQCDDIIPVHGKERRRARSQMALRLERSPSFSTFLLRLKWSRKRTGDARQRVARSFLRQVADNGRQSSREK